MRVIHRYLGFFLAGIMAVYALSGIVLIFRNTDFLKKVETNTLTIAPNLTENELGKALKMNRFKVDKEENNVLYFRDGNYNSETGEAVITKKELPYVLDKMTHLHKAKSGDPLYFLNVFFGIALLFFVLSAFWMYLPKTDVFKKGMIYTAAGIVLTLVLLFV